MKRASNRKLVILSGMIVALSLIASPRADAQDDTDTLTEQQRAHAVEQAPRTPRTATLSAEGRTLGSSHMLFVGVDDIAEFTYLIDPATDTAEQVFSGFEAWGAAVIPGASPGDAVVFFNDGADLYRWEFPDPPTFCCTLLFDGSTSSVVSAAWDATAGNLLFTKNISVEAVYSLPVDPGSCPASCDLTQEIVYASGDNDFGGLAMDNDNGILYGTNDDSTPGPRGVYEINADGTTTLVVAYPTGETDIDCLGYGAGKLYLATDEPGDIYVYDVATETFDAPLTNPWTTSEVFCGADAGSGLFVPVELEGFTVE